MSTRKILEGILENGLGAAYQEAIRKCYQRSVEDGICEAEERKYDAGIAELEISFSPEKKAQLTISTIFCHDYDVSKDQISKLGLPAKI